MSTHYRNSRALSSCAFALCLAACTASAPSEGGASGEPPAEVQQALGARETTEAIATLQGKGWVRSEARSPRVERADDGHTAVVLPMEKESGEGSLDLVYVAPDAKAGTRALALVRAEDEATRASLVQVRTMAEVTPDAAAGCAVGCDALPSACVDWTCAYTSYVGLTFACLGLGNSVGVFHVVTVRAGRTDPSRCALPVLDVFGQAHSCPAPATSTSLFVCGWP